MEINYNLQTPTTTEFQAMMEDEDISLTPPATLARVPDLNTGKFYRTWWHPVFG
jgi:hypothetical protein